MVSIGRATTVILSFSLGQTFPPCQAWMLHAQSVGWECWRLSSTAPWAMTREWKRHLALWHQAAVFRAILSPLQPPMRLIQRPLPLRPLPQAPRRQHAWARIRCSRQTIVTPLQSHWASLPTHYCRPTIWIYTAKGSLIWWTRLSVFPRSARLIPGRVLILATVSSALSAMWLFHSSLHGILTSTLCVWIVISSLDMRCAWGKQFGSSCPIYVGPFAGYTNVLPLALLVAI